MKTCPLCHSNPIGSERRLNDIDLLRCSSCGFVFADLVPDLIQELNAKYTEEAGASYAQVQTRADEIWFQGIAAHFTRRLRAGKVLDVGCGNGLLLSQFKSMGWDCWGVDPSPWSLGFAERYGFKLHKGYIEDGVLDNEAFDLVVSSSTMEHVADPRPHVDAILRCLRPAGYAYFCGIPNYASLAVRFGFTSFYMNKPPGHVNYFTPRTLRYLFAVTDPPARYARVRSYGIPELHRLYHIVLRFRRKSKPKIEKQSGEHPVQVDDQKSENRNPLTWFLLRAMLAAAYNLGRLGKAGDKLEALIQK